MFSQTLSPSNLFSFVTFAYLDDRNWSCYASAELRVLAQKEGCEPISKRMIFASLLVLPNPFSAPIPLDISHVFTSKEDNWGFPYYTEWAVNCESDLEIVSFLMPFLFRN